MFHRILLCSDGSDNALHAARAAGEIARRCGSQVTMLTVTDVTAAIAPYMGQWETVAFTEDLLECAEQAQKQAVESTARVLDSVGVDYTPVRETGHPVDVIAAVAEREHSDLIVMGCRGMTAWNALLLGSVADGVVHHSHVPALIVRGDNPSFADILLASDGSAAACRAAAAAGELARSFDADITLLHVLEPVYAHTMIVRNDLEPEPSLYSTPDTKVCAAYEAIKQCGARCQAAHETGHPAQVIISYADAHNSDLIVMGSRGRGAFKSMLLGSVSSRVMHYASKSVLIVH